MDEYDIDVDITIMTSGDGYWSSKKKPVRITKIKARAHELEGDIEWNLNVYFDPDYWDIRSDGLIYTDKGFEKSLKDELIELSKAERIPSHLPWERLSYTEQGMQGEKFVHMILGDW